MKIKSTLDQMELEKNEELDRRYTHFQDEIEGYKHWDWKEWLLGIVFAVAFIGTIYLLLWL